MATGLGRLAVAAGCLLSATALWAGGASEPGGRLVVLPLSSVGLAASIDSLELGERLRSAIDDIPELGVVSKGITDSLFGVRGIDLEGCPSASGWRSYEDSEGRR